MDTLSGKVTEITRDNSTEKFYEKYVDPKYLNKKKYDQELKKDEEQKDEVRKDHKKKENATPKVQSSMPADWDAQRDIAFNIMYFFLAFIAATFSLLYVYFKTTTSRQSAQKNKRSSDEER